IIKDHRLADGTFLKCVDGRWTAKDSTPITDETVMLVEYTFRGLQRWHDGEVEALGHIDGRRVTQDDADNRNAAIPEKEWEPGFDGKPKPPWRYVYGVRLMEPKTYASFTFLNDTRGAERAVHDLEKRMENAASMEGVPMKPFIKFGHTPMPTKHKGVVKERPVFIVVWWHLPDGKVLEAKPTLQIASSAKAEPAAKVGKPLSWKDELSDEIPW